MRVEDVLRSRLTYLSCWSLAANQDSPVWLCLCFRCALTRKSDAKQCPGTGICLIHQAHCPEVRKRIVCVPLLPTDTVLAVVRETLLSMLHVDTVYSFDG